MLPFFTDELVNPSVHLCPACLFLIALTVKETLCNSEKVTDYKTESHNTSLLQLHTCCSFACCWCNTLKMLQDQNQEAAKLRKVLKAAGEKFSAILSLLIVCSVMIKNTAVSVFHNPGWDCVCVCVCMVRVAWNEGVARQPAEEGNFPILCHDSSGLLHTHAAGLQ